MAVVEMWPKRQRRVGRTVIGLAIVAGVTAVSISVIVTFGGHPPMSATSSAATRPTTPSASGGAVDSGGSAPAPGEDRGVRSARARTGATGGRAATAPAFAPAVCCVLNGAVPAGGGSPRVAKLLAVVPGGQGRSVPGSAGRRLHHHQSKHRAVRSHRRLRGRHGGKRSRPAVGPTS